MRYLSDDPRHQFSYQITHEFHPNCVPLLPPYEPCFYISVQVRYSLVDNKGCCQKSLGESDVNVYLSRRKSLFDFWMLYVGRIYRRVGVPDVVAVPMLKDLFDFALTMEAHPTSAVKEILPILVVVEVHNLQFEDESFDMALKWAIQHDTFAPLPRTFASVDVVHEKFLEDMDYNCWILNQGVNVNECSICWEDDHVVKGNGIRFPCSHIFHTACIFKWILHNQTCPLCRSPVFSSSALCLERIANERRLRPTRNSDFR